MSARVIVVAEDRLGFELATSLCDRVVAERSEWLHDHWADETSRSAFRVWSKLDLATQQRWTTRADIKRLSAGRRQTHGLKAEGALVYKAVKLAHAERTEGEAVAVIVVHDTDGDEGALESMKDGRDRALEMTTDRTKSEALVAAPHPEVEAWVAAGFAPESEEEERRLAVEHARLGFNPVAEPHRLSSRKRFDTRDAKRICAALLGCDHGNDTERWSRCWEDTPLDLLEERGAGAHLRAFTGEVGERLLPVLGDRIR